MLSGETTPQTPNTEATHPRGPEYLSPGESTTITVKVAGKEVELTVTAAEDFTPGQACIQISYNGRQAQTNRANPMATDKFIHFIIVNGNTIILEEEQNPRTRTALLRQGSFPRKKLLQVSYAGTNARQGAGSFGPHKAQPRQKRPKKGRKKHRR